MRLKERKFTTSICRHFEKFSSQGDNKVDYGLFLEFQRKLIDSVPELMKTTVVKIGQKEKKNP